MRLIGCRPIGCIPPGYRACGRRRSTNGFRGACPSGQGGQGAVPGSTGRPRRSSSDLCRERRERATERKPYEHPQAGTGAGCTPWGTPRRARGMKRADGFADARWDDPFWHVVRMLVDETRGHILAEPKILPSLEAAGTPASRGLVRYLASRPEMVPRLAEYTRFRDEACEHLLMQARTEDEALADFANISSEVVAKYGTQSGDHHQSSKVMVKTIEVLTRAICLEHGLQVDVDPQKRATIISDDHIWVSPRRLDGALPSLLNPVGLWEIKEYWGGHSRRQQDERRDLRMPACRPRTSRVRT